MDASVNQLTTPSLEGWLKLYNLTFIVGIAMSFTWMVILCYFSPPLGLGIDEPFVGMGGGAQSDASHDYVVEGVEQKEFNDAYRCSVSTGAADDKGFKGDVHQV